MSFSLLEPMGLELEEADESLRVKRVIPGGQAQRDGRVRGGDAVTMVGATEVFDMASFEKGISDARSRKKTQVLLTVARKNETPKAAVVSSKETSELRATLAALKEKERQDEEALRKSRAALKEMEAAKVSAEREAKAKIAELENMRNELAEKLSEKLSEREASADLERKGREDLETALAAARRQNEELRLDNKELRAEKEKLRVENAEANKKTATNDEENRRSLTLKMDEERRTSASTISTLRREATESKARIESLEAEKKALQNEKKQLEVEQRDRREQQRQESTSKEGRVYELESKITKAEALARDANKRAVDARTALDDARAERLALETKLRAAQDRASRLDSELRTNTHHQKKTTPQTLSGSGPPVGKRFFDNEHWDRRHQSDCQGGAVSLLVTTLRAIDDLALSTVAIVRQSPAARVLSILYLLFIHLWLLALVAAHAYALDTLQLREDNNNPGGSSNNGLRGSVQAA